MIRESDSVTGGLRNPVIDPSSYVDPNGFVFHHQNGYYRAIYDHVAPFYFSLIKDGVIDDLVQNHHLVETTLSKLTVDQPRIGLVLKHETIEPLNYCVEWCLSMLRDAAMAILDLSLAIGDRNCILQDCYPWNVIFRGTDPIVVDFTSIVPAETPLIWPAYEHFRAFFLRPLHLYMQHKGAVARALLENNIAGISPSTLSLYSGAGYLMWHPSLVIEASLESFFQNRPDWQVKVRKNLDATQKHPDSRTRKAFLDRLQKQTADFRFRKTRDVWSHYYEQMPSGVSKEVKLETMDRILGELRPSMVLDIGCNTGVFSVLAAKQGARVMAIDSSEVCIESLYAQASREKLTITPLLADLYCPTPPAGFMAKQYPGLMERAKSDLVLCLGLMHHLHITGRQSIPRIAEFVNALSRKYLVFEFVDSEDDKNILLRAGRTIRYTLEEVRAALGKYFTQIDSLPSDRSTRTLLVCSK